MTGRLKALERRLACLRAQAVLYPVAEEFAGRWYDAFDRGEPPPDTFDLIEAAGRVAVPVLTVAPVDAYLKRCAKAAHVPDPNRVVMAIVHGYAEARLIGLYGETCTCPARQPLLKPRRTFGGSSDGVGQR